MFTRFGRFLASALKADRVKIQTLLDQLAKKQLSEKQIADLQKKLDGIVAKPKMIAEKAIAYLLRGSMREHHLYSEKKVDATIVAKSIAPLDPMAATINDYQQAAYAGNIDAMIFLAEIYKNKKLTAFDLSQSAFWYRCALKYSPQKYHRGIKLSLIQLLRPQPSVELEYQIATAFQDHDDFLVSKIESIPDDKFKDNDKLYKMIENDHLLDPDVKAFYLKNVFLKKERYFQVKKYAPISEPSLSEFKSEIKMGGTDDILLNRHIDCPIADSAPLPLHLLHRALENGWLNVANFVSDEMKTDLENDASISTQQLLDQAFLAGHVKTARTVIAKIKIDKLDLPRSFSTRGLMGTVEHKGTPVFLAAANLNFDMLHYLIEEAKLNYQNRMGDYNLFDFIMLQASRRSLSHKKLNEVIRIIKFISKKLILSNELTPLHWAAKYNNVELATALTEQLDANILAKDKDGITPFHLADDHMAGVYLRPTYLKSYFAKNTPIAKDEPGYLRLNDITYKITALASGKSVFLLEDKAGNKCVAKQFKQHHFIIGDQTGLQEARHYQAILGYGQRVFCPHHPDSCFVLMPFFPGKSLGVHSENRMIYASLSPTGFFNTFLATETAVSSLHTQYQVVHGDLNASNIILNNGKVTLIDFGHMCNEGEDYKVSRYVHFAKGVGQQAKFSDDVYALGVTFSELYNAINTAALSATEKSILEKLHRYKLQPLFARMMAEDSLDRPTLNEIPIIVNSALTAFKKALPPVKGAEEKITIAPASSLFGNTTGTTTLITSVPSLTHTTI